MSLRKFIGSTRGVGRHDVTQYKIKYNFLVNPITRSEITGYYVNDGEIKSEQSADLLRFLKKVTHQHNVPINPKIVVMDMYHYQPLSFSSHILFTELKNLYLF